MERPTKYSPLEEDILTRGDSRYFLVARTEDHKDIFLAPLCLDGSESIDKAVARFRDALICSKQAFSRKGEYHPAGSGIDGKPRTEREIATALFWAKGKVLNWEGMAETEEFRRLHALSPTKPKFLGILHQGEII